MTKKHDRKEFLEIAEQVGKLVQEKNAAYGSAFQVSGQVLKYFYPDGITPDKYQDLLLIARILDKLMRIASRKHAFGESPYTDIIGYGILGKWLDQQPPEDGPHVAGGVPDKNPPLSAYLTRADVAKVKENGEAIGKIIEAFSKP